MNPELDKLEAVIKTHKKEFCGYMYVACDMYSEAFNILCPCHIPKANNINIILKI